MVQIRWKLSKSINSQIRKNQINTYRPLLSFDKTQVDLPQNGDKSHDLPGSTVAHFVDAKHIPGKSIDSNEKKGKNKIQTTETNRKNGNY